MPLRRRVVGAITPQSRIPSVEDIKTETRKIMAFQKNPKMKPILNYADENRKAGRFTDVIIKVENENIPAHRVVLACYSKYFEGMFATEMSEKYQNAVVIEGFDCVVVKSIIDYFYAEKIVIDSSNVVKLLEASDYLQVDDIKSFCFEFLESGLTVDSCLQVIAAYNFFKPQASLNRAYQYVSEHLEKITLEENFKALSKDELSSIIGKLDPKIVSESSKFTTIMKWIKHDAEIRKGELTELFQLIDLFQVKYEFLENAVTIEPLIKDNINCMNSLLKCYIGRRQKTSGSKIICISNDSERSQISVEEVHSVFSKTVTKYPINLPLTESKLIALSLNQSVFLIYISMRESYVRSPPVVFQLNLQKDFLNWKKVATLNGKKSKFAATVHKECLIVAGGCESQYNSPTSDVQVYEMSANTWRTIASLNSPRMNFALASNGEHVFAIGGYHANQPLSSVERLSSLDGKWEMVASMSIARSNVAAVCCDGFVYAVGGVSSSGIEKTVEKYSLGKNEWSQVASMNAAREEHFAGVLCGKIVVAGGKSSGSVRTVECYDPVSAAWSLLNNGQNYDIPWNAAFVVV